MGMRRWAPQESILSSNGRNTAMRAGKHTPKAFAEALAQAEKLLVPRTESDPREVKLRPREIQVWPELFQPREFLYGAFDVDNSHVKKLEREIGHKGELEPIV